MSTREPLLTAVGLAVLVAVAGVAALAVVLGGVVEAIPGVGARSRRRIEAGTVGLLDRLSGPLDRLPEPPRR